MTDTLMAPEAYRRQEPETNQRTPLRTLDLEWTESEWFQVWLKLAREPQEAERN